MSSGGRWGARLVRLPEAALCEDPGSLVAVFCAGSSSQCALPVSGCRHKETQPGDCVHFGRAAAERVLRHFSKVFDTVSWYSSCRWKHGLVRFSTPFKQLFLTALVNGLIDSFGEMD